VSGFQRCGITCITIPSPVEIVTETAFADCLALYPIGRDDNRSLWFSRLSISAAREVYSFVEARCSSVCSLCRVRPRSLPQIPELDTADETMGRIVARSAHLPQILEGGRFTRSLTFRLRLRKEPLQRANPVGHTGYPV
jgi:hypothetical protein